MAGPTAETEAFLTKAELAFETLFSTAKAKNELHFALSLGPEFRGEQGPGWCAWEETNRAFDEYVAFLEDKSGIGQSFRIRVALSFYCHLSEASGYYETPKNLLRILSGDGHSMIPFQELNRFKKTARIVIPPNSNAVFSDMMAHASSIGLQDLAEVFRDAFDPDLRNGYAHADYIIWSDGLRLRKKAGGRPRLVTWNEFEQAMIRAIEFYRILRITRANHIEYYRTPRRIVGGFTGEPAREWEIGITPHGMFKITTC